MAASTFDFYDEFTEYSMDGTIDLDADTFKLALFSSTSNAATLSTSGYANLTNEVANGLGYTTGGQALTSVTWVRSAGTTTFDSADVVWTASGGSITARYAVMYDDTVTTPVADPLVGNSLLDTTPDDVTATDGNTLTVAPSASGWFTLST